jgi:hypothetical protein
MLFSRRTFLKHLSMGASLMLASSPLSLLAAPSPSRRRYYLVSAQNQAFQIDLQKGTTNIVDISFNAHSYIVHPDHPSFVLGIEKWGASAAFIDLKKPAVVHAFNSPKGTEFYGHGVFLREKNAFFVTRVEMESGQGHLVGYDADTYKEVFDYPVTPGGLHECHLLPNRTLLVASSGIRPRGYGSGAQKGPRVEASGLTHVDMATGRVLGKKLIGDDNQIIGHFALAKNGNFIALSGPRVGTSAVGQIYIGSVGSNDLRRLEWLDRYDTKGEMLSVSIDENHRMAAVTNPTSDNLFFVDIRTGEDRGNVPRNAFGVAYDPGKEQFLFSGGEVFYANEKEAFSPILSGFRDPSPYFDGAHGLIV